MRSHAVHHTRGKGDSGCALPPSSLLQMATEEDNGRHTQLPACTTKEAFKPTAMCILCACVVVCACRSTKQNIRKKGAEYAERRTKKCTAEVHGGNNYKRRPLKLMTSLQPKQWQPIQNLFKTNQTLPLHPIQTPPHKIIILEKKSSITVPHKFKSKKIRLAAVWPHQTVCIYFAHKRKLKRYLHVFRVSDPLCVRTSFTFHGVICALLLPSALSSAREGGPQRTVTLLVCVGGERSKKKHDGSRVSPSGE
ncbi:hypothetical protein ECC02_004109 [Trypanosoma cruzi]|uniref:Uncharacterized protein n=1 Tax=Trypanosoma cruzi TaxID=5693 RepID=A0A7J6Y9J8_TRYCR|nr:hypothetical protein ECC02_004109 [Trypanosoma cruzi]